VALIQSRRYRSHNVVGDVYWIAIDKQFPYIVRKPRLNSKIRRVNLRALPSFSTPAHRVNIVLWIYLVRLGEKENFGPFGEPYKDSVNQWLNRYKPHCASDSGVRED
jgi:hypothetical protein